MKRVPLFFQVASLFLVVPSSYAQESVRPQQPLHAPDGGTIEHFTSIAIPPKADAPFTATVNTEWIRNLPDGSKITLKNHRSVARDARGRIFEERASFVPDDGKHESAVYQVEISDPATHERYVCSIAGRVCRVHQYFAPASVARAAANALVKKGGAGVENLGTQIVAGLETTGTRETTLIETGAIGNESPILERREFWYSPQLGVNLITRREEVRFNSRENFEVTNVALGEPDAKLFDPPAGFKIIDLRNPSERPASASASPD